MSEQENEIGEQDSKPLPSLFPVEKALIDAVTEHANTNAGLHAGDVITVPGYPAVTVTVTQGAEGEPFGLDVKGVTLGDPRDR